MKKYKVLANFIDRFTKKYHAAGTIYETDNEERVEELISKGFLGEELQKDSQEHESSSQNEDVKEKKTGRRKNHS
ncbi:hypothetical protein [Thermaerobacillus caldiproteolyticus]|uniref:hypothetical protein n=1 Tax=Thermaerobacillus caldiproteolyticus TaxID=247480 RepID=UPI0018F24D10|nr:hypothetical protein [Anoxybacillus caldiproteolyticus]